MLMSLRSVSEPFYKQHQFQRGIKNFCVWFILRCNVCKLKSAFYIFDLYLNNRKISSFRRFVFFPRVDSPSFLQGFVDNSCTWLFDPACESIKIVIYAIVPESDAEPTPKESANRKPREVVFFLICFNVNSLLISPRSSEKKCWRNNSLSTIPAFHTSKLCFWSVKHWNEIVKLPQLLLTLSQCSFHLKRFVREAEWCYI